METGILLADRYTVDEHVGSGPTGSVWFGHDTLLDKPVRIKSLSPELACDDAARQRFRTTAVAVAELHHPSIIDVYDCVEERRGDEAVSCQIATRVEGVPLRDVLSAGDAWEASATLAFIAEIALVLHDAHQAGVRHHNLTPDNLIVRDDGAVTVVDFAFTTPPPGPYVAPELTRGEPGGEMSDVFSLGAIAFECLTGTPPVDGGDPSTLATDVSPAVAALVTRALTPRPGARFASAQVLAAECQQVDFTAEVLGPLLRRPTPGTDLVAVAASDVVVVDAETPPPVAKRPTGRWRLGLAAAVLAAVVAGAVVSHLPFGHGGDTAGGGDPAGVVDSSSSPTGGADSSSSAASTKPLNDPSSHRASSHRASSSHASPDPTVPYVVGHDAHRAAGELSDAGFNVNTITSGHGQFQCPVRDQSPNGGTTAPSGSTVDLTVRLANNVRQCYQP
ncbi:MAG TPA: serine/threonine protein kinase [Stackebrandtia sp.]|jgi:serine/threonine-protein kinase|uniref:serine/threonine protein kinase n=1 Tax=Stackebrandtia sp. TaxID=2023065 RepID=UPI002D226E24|nr:serine/threonine protein kinase [Stackebrandtia sp.]HZE40810.1 serine/threonine protein kinase [Stackebrandtia sp.]